MLGLQSYWQRPTRERNALNRLHHHIYAGGIESRLRWMRGEVSTRDRASGWGIDVTDDLLIEQLYAGWPDLSHLNLPLLETVRQLHPGARHWIVTDNIDVFTPWLHTQRRFTTDFAGVVNSADHGAFKRDGLFDIALRTAGVDAHRTVFLDDSADNCQVFAALGGLSVLIPDWTPTPHAS